MIPKFPALGAVGRGLAIAICMILVIIRMKVLSEALKLVLNLTARDSCSRLAVNSLASFILFFQGGIRKFVVTEPIVVVKKRLTSFSIDAQRKSGLRSELSLSFMSQGEMAQTSLFYPP